MSDPLERMAGFRSEVEGGPMLAADEVRRRGDRIRKRRHAAIAVGSALAVAVIVAPIALLTAGGSPDRIQPAPAPATPTRPEEALTLTEANLMTEDDTEFDGQAAWLPRQTFSWDTPRVGNPCQREAYSDLGAEAVFQRTWGLEAHSLHQVVAQFPSTASAEAAYADVGGWLLECSPSGSSETRTEALPSVALPVDGEVMAFESTFRIDSEEGGEAFSDHLVITGIAITGDRLTVLSHDMPDDDYDWGPTSPVERMLPAAATRLVGVTAQPDQTDAHEPSGSALPDEGNLVDPASLPRVPRMDPWEAVPPRSIPTLVCQGAWLSALGPDGNVTGKRRAADPNGENDVDSAKVNVAILQYGDTDAADAAYDTVLGWLENCPASQTDAEPRIEVPAAPVEIATSPDVAGVDRAHQVRVFYGAPEACGSGDCDAGWFDHQTVAQVGDRLVLVTYAELAGQCPPGDVNGDTCLSEEDQQPWLDRAQQALEATVERAAEGSR